MAKEDFSAIAIRAICETVQTAGADLVEAVNKGFKDIKASIDKSLKTAQGNLVDGFKVHVREGLDSGFQKVAKACEKQSFTLHDADTKDLAKALRYHGGIFQELTDIKKLDPTGAEEERLGSYTSKQSRLKGRNYKLSPLYQIVRVADFLELLSDQIAGVTPALMEAITRGSTITPDMVVQAMLDRATSQAEASKKKQ